MKTIYSSCSCRPDQFIQVGRWQFPVYYICSEHEWSTLSPRITHTFDYVDAEGGRGCVPTHCWCVKFVDVCILSRIHQRFSVIGRHDGTL